MESKMNPGHVSNFPSEKGTLRLLSWSQVNQSGTVLYYDDSQPTKHLFIWNDWTLTACTASSRSFSCSSWGDCVAGCNGIMGKKNTLY